MQIRLFLKIYELRYCSFIFNQSNNKFDAHFFARDGNIFSKRWRQRINEKIMIQVDSLTLDENKKHALAHVLFNEFDEESHRNKCLKLLGGQTHIRCEEHKLPLISLRDKNK